MIRAYNGLLDNLLKERNIIRLDDYKGSKTKIRFQCLKDNYIWETRPDVIIPSKHGCPKCCNQICWKNETIDFELNKMLYGIKRLGNYKNDKTSIEWQCEKCSNIWETRWDVLQRGSRCPECYIKTRRLDKEHIIQFCKEKSFECIDLENYRNIYTKLHFRCLTNQEHIFNISFSNFSNHEWCSLCFPFKTRETYVGEILKEKINTDQIISQYKLIFNNRRYYVDFFINNKNIIIEYNGQQHYEPVRFNKSQSDSDIEKLFIKQQKRDNELKKYCLDNNIKFVEIHYKKTNKEIKEILDNALKSEVSN